MTEVTRQSMVGPNAPAVRKRAVGAALWLGIAVLPIVFSWFTLAKGRSGLARVLAFGWLGVSIIALGTQQDERNEHDTQSALATIENFQSSDMLSPKAETVTEAEAAAPREAELDEQRRREPGWEAERAEREAQRAELEAERETERVELEAKRAAEQAEREAQRAELEAEREAERAEREAQRAERKAAKAAQKLEEKRKGFHCISGLTGTHRQVVRTIKRMLNDPKSFEHDETRVTPVVDNRHQFIMRYRARNAFGGLVVAFAKGSYGHEACDDIEITQVQ